MIRTLPRAALLLGVASIGLFGGREAAAAGFAIRENSAEALGTAFAGNASSATFLSTIFNNPAGMTHFTGDRVQLDGSLILPSLRFEGSATQTFPGPVTLPVGGGGSGNGGGAAFIPALYYLHSFSPDFKFGLAMTAPYGLATIYPDNWVGRYLAVKSEIQTLDFNPNLAYRVNNWLSIGGGMSAQYINADLSSAIDQTAFGAADGRLRVHGDAVGWGYNAGILVEPMPGSSLGLTYRSRIRHDISGSADFTNISAGLAGLAGPAVASSSARAPLTTPDSIDFSVTQAITDKIKLAGDVQWTHWSVFQTLGVLRTSGALNNTNLAAPTPENFKDTIFVSLGGTYNYDDNWTFRMGVAYDESPVTDAFRTVRLPDSDRYWLAAGVGYKFSDGFSVDFGVAHIFMPNASLNTSVNSTTSVPGGTSTITGKFVNQIDLVSLQTRFRF